MTHKDSENQRVVWYSSPARGGGDRSAGRDRPGRVLLANDIVVSCVVFDVIYRIVAQIDKI